MLVWGALWWPQQAVVEAVVGLRMGGQNWKTSKCTTPRIAQLGKTKAQGLMASQWPSPAQDPDLPLYQWLLLVGLKASPPGEGRLSVQEAQSPVTVDSETAGS